MNDPIQAFIELASSLQEDGKEPQLIIDMLITLMDKEKKDNGQETE
jgi:hypothetical protein